MQAKNVRLKLYLFTGGSKAIALRGFRTITLFATASK